MSRTTEILASIKVENTEAIAKLDATTEKRVATRGARNQRDGVVRAGGPRYALATGTGRREALAAIEPLLRANMVDGAKRNDDRKLQAGVRRVNGMVRQHGRQTPDMLESLLAFFRNPSDVTERALVTALPEKVSMVQAKALFADSFVVDVLEGLGHSVPASLPTLIRAINPGSGRAGGRPRKVRTYVGTLTGHSRPYTSTALPTGRIPTAEGPVMVGAGRDAGAGWSEAWANGKALTPAQRARRDAALDAINMAARAQCEAE